ncbi:PGL/p-HBAD biosynthesis glycosyltransferase (plasmid) [Roseivivax sp. THAF40]|uniref:glycosyltransferase family 2 protein n=1 Tax=Roseivivax sp. THAF40 TaxID=2587858 RepID=UPI001269664E|nr:glycosyltransferase family 2 protein [Roseivivax sp. THAF40]QFT48726.1 PGL/p-HBAD biosynthesis glycosyltransferase [Roseivivax sp. THAF40]
MKISIVTAVYNRLTTIDEALDSVAAQSHADIEHVIQDGGSSDGTVCAITARQDPLISFTSEPDFGIYDAINRGISRATGDVIGLMHSDDFFADECVLARVADILSDSTIDGVYGDLDYVHATDPSRIIRRWRSGAYNSSLLRKGWMPPHPTLYLRRDVFERHGVYDTSFRIAADYDAMLRYLVKGQIKLAYIPEVMVKMRVGGESNRSLRKILQKSREDYRAIRRNGVGGIPTLAMKNLSKIRQFF